MKYLFLFALILVSGLVMASKPSWKDNPMRMGNNAANELFEQQKYEEALKQYLDYYGQKANQGKQDPDLGALAYNLGNTYAVLGDMEKAREFYDKALQSGNPEAIDLARFNLGNLNMGAQNPGEAVKQYIDYLKAHPDDVDAKRNLELALRMMEQQQQQQNQDKQDQEQNQDQQDQQDQQQSQDQQSQDQQNQDQQDQQDQQNQDQQNQDQQNQDQQDQQDQQNKDQQNQDEQSQDQKDQQEQQNQKDEEQKEQEKQQQQLQEEQNQDKMSDAMKEQILQALKEQEMQQQKEYQKRKIGTSKRRAKDW